MNAYQDVPVNSELQELSALPNSARNMHQDKYIAEEELKECCGDLRLSRNQHEIVKESSLIEVTSQGYVDVYRPDDDEIMPFEEANSLYRQRVTTTEACEIFDNIDHV